MQPSYPNVLSMPDCNWPLCGQAPNGEERQGVTVKARTAPGIVAALGITLQAIEAATRVAAQARGVSPLVGTLEAGKRADLL
jgi:predicted amidohydrolase YtcJ